MCMRCEEQPFSNVLQDEEDSKPEAPPTPKANGMSKEAKLRSKDEAFKAQEQNKCGFFG